MPRYTHTHTSLPKCILFMYSARVGPGSRTHWLELRRQTLAMLPNFAFHTCSISFSKSNPRYLPYPSKQIPTWDLPGFALTTKLVCTRTSYHHRECGARYCAFHLEINGRKMLCQASAKTTGQDWGCDPCFGMVFATRRSHEMNRMGTRSPRIAFSTE